MKQAVNLTTSILFLAVQHGRRLDVDSLPDMSDTCLGCICEATTNCNMTIGCMRGLCGPFLISKAYWVDSGRPTVPRDNPDRQGAYETCANDPYCSANAVRQYMARFAQVYFHCYLKNFCVNLEDVDAEDLFF